ncbi:MAG: immunoglobulin domain-containing protein [Bacteroidia bacterium]|nr:immunoglobulin domain-containing protein [Bacteroidia bacterium]
MKKIFLVVIIISIFSSVLYSQTDGDYRSFATGNWNATGTWQVYSGGSWTPASATPTSADGAITILNTHVVTVTVDVTVDQVTINSGGTITISSGQILTLANGTGDEITVASGGILDIQGTLAFGGIPNRTVQVSGTLKNSGSITTPTAAKLFFLSGSFYEHLFTTTNGTIPTASWNSTSTCTISGYTTNTTAPAGLSQTFGNFTWNCASQTSTISFTGLLTTVTGNLTITSTGTGVFYLTTTTDFTLNVTGNVACNGGTFGINETTGIGIVNVTGNFSMTNNAYLQLAVDGNVTMNITGTITISGVGAPTLDFSAGLGTGTINLQSGFTCSAATASITNSIAVAGRAVFNFSGTANQAYSITPALGTAIINFTVNASAIVSIDNTNKIDGAGTFTLASAGTLKIGSTAGIVSAGASGNIQNTGTRTFNIAGNYEYNGTAAQVTGNALPATVNNLTTNNAAGVTFSAAVAVSGNLSVSSGSLSNGGFAITGTAGGALSVAAASTLTLTSTSAFPASFGTNTLNATSTVNYAGTAQAIATQTYGHLTLSGSGTKTLAATTSVAGNLSTNGVTVATAGYTLNITSNYTNAGATTYSGGGTLALTGNFTNSNTLDIGTTAFNVAGNWINNSTFTANSGTVTFNGSTTLSGSSTTSFNNVTISNTLTGVSSGNFNVAGTFTNNGTFTHNSGTVTFTGIDKSITGSATTTFNNLTTNITGDGKIIIPSGKSATVSGTLTIGSTDTLMVDVSSGGVNGSLITNGSIINNGTCKLKTAISSGKWHCVSSAVSSINIETVFDNPTTNGRKYYLETEAVNYWQPSANPSLHTGNMNVGQGYYIYYGSNKYERYSGTFNNANASPAITYGVRNWNLVGNPFPCAISWATVYASTANVDGSIQIRNGTSWTVISQLDGSPYVQPGQGFFVKASAGSPTITIGTSARLHNASGTFLKTTSPYTYLTLKVSSGSLNSITRFFFLNDATNDFDHPYDADKLWDDNPNVPELFSISAQSDTLALNALPIITNDLVIPLGINASLPGAYTLNAEEILNFDSTIEIYLEDVITSTITNLRTTPDYTFTISSPAIKDLSRFNLRFSLTTPPVITQDISALTKCEGETVSLTVTATGSPAPTYQWYGPVGELTGETNNILSFSSVSASDAGDYYCVVTNSYGAVQSANATLTVNTPVAVTTHPASETKCEGENISLSVSATGTNPAYQWQKDGIDITGANEGSYNISSSQSTDAGIYTCVISNICNTVTTNEAVVVVNAYPVVDMGSDITECEGTPVILHAGNPGAAYLWNDLSANEELNVTFSGIYSVNVTKDGCSASDEIFVTINPLPVVNLGNDITMCEGTSVALHAGNPGAAYLWNDLSANEELDVTASGIYSVNVTKDGCSSSDEISVTINPFPIVNLGNDITACEGTPVTLDAGNPGAAYLWNDLSANEELDVTASGIYSVNVTKDGCSASDQINVIIKPAPYVELGNDVFVCNGSSVTLDAGYTTGNSYNWSNGQHYQVIHPITGGLYSVTVTGENGCNSTDQVNVTFNQNPVVALGNDISVCEGTLVTLDAGNTGSAYVWNTQETTQTISPVVSGIYSVDVSQNGCTGQSSITVTFKPNPVIDLGMDISVCSGAQVTLDAGYINGNAYLWSNNSHNEIIHPTESGAYSVTVTNNGCSGTDAVNVAINPLPVVNLGSNQFVCEGTNVILDAGNTGATYLWNDGSTNQQLTATATAAYSVAVTDINGCTSYDEVIITFKPLPVVDLGQDVVTCEGTNIALDAGYISGNTYTWSTGSHYQTITVTESGTYTVTVSNNGCENNDQLSLTVNPLPQVELGPDTVICQGCSVTLNAGNAGSAYLWSTGDSVQTITVSTAGIYTVTVTSPEGCSAGDQISVSVATEINTLTDNSGISIYPNPASDKIQISGNKANSIIEITDLTGKILIHFVADKDRTNIDISKLSNGIYLVKIISDKVAVYKIVKN